MPNILSIVGARPQFIKAAPVSRALRAEGLTEILVHTGQHFDALMSDVFFEELDIPPPKYNLEINSLGHGAMTGRMLESLEGVMVRERPDIVLIYGDTNSTVAGALAAAKLHIRVAHVEAGLRSFNRRMPEEINRVIADHLSEFLLCPTSAAVRNLAREGIVSGVHAIGDVMYDMTLATTQKAGQRSLVLKRLELEPKSYAVATIHRAENTDNSERLARVIAWLEAAALRMPVVLPMHPRTRNLLKERQLSPAGLQVIDPLGYLDMTWLVHNAAAVYTDSGGLQKEAYFHRVPCVTLREETEWVETVESGWNRLWTSEAYARERCDISEYGDGNSASIVAKLMKEAC